MAKKDDGIKDLDQTILDLRKKFGETAVIRGNMVVRNVEGLPTGAISLDNALGVGGIPRGRVSEIFGPEASGKTTICLEVIAGVQRNGGTAAFIDVEHALDTKYAAALGVDMEKLLFAQPGSGEEAFEICEALAKTGKVTIIVIDSIAALVPKAELEGDMDAASMGGQARLMGKGLRKLVAVINKTNTAIMFTNQLRQKIGVMFGNPETTSGGKAVAYYASTRLDIRRQEAIKDDGAAIGSKIKVTVKKNKVATPFKEAFFDIIYGKGIDKVGCLIETAIELELIKKAGSTLKFDGKGFNGYAKLREYLEQDNRLATLDNDVRTQLKLVPVKVVDEDLPAPEDTITIGGEVENE